MKNYKINPLAVLFHKKFDVVNNYEIYVYDTESDNVRSLNYSGYWILNALNILGMASGKMILEYLGEKVNLPEQEVEEFLEKLAGENIVIRMTN